VLVVKLSLWINSLKKLLWDKTPFFSKVHDLTEKPTATLVPQVFPNPRPNLMFDLRDENLKRLEVDELLEVTPSKVVEIEGIQKLFLKKVRLGNISEKKFFNLNYLSKINKKLCFFFQL